MGEKIDRKEWSHYKIYHCFGPLLFRWLSYNIPYWCCSSMLIDFFIVQIQIYHIKFATQVFYDKQFKSVQVSHILAKAFAWGRVPWEKTLRFTFLDLYSILFMILQNKYIINSLTYNQDDIMNYIFMALYLKLFHKKFVSYQFLLSFFSTPFALVL